MHLKGIISFLAAIVTTVALTGCKEQTREEKEFNETKKYANTGGYHAQMYLGSFYERGHGTEKDTKKAIECYLRALELMHEEKQKLPTTVEGWKKLAAEETHSNRIDYLLGLYFEGRIQYNPGEVRVEDPTKSNPHSKNEARKYYQKAVNGDLIGEYSSAYMRLVELSEDARSEKDYLLTASTRGSSQAVYELSKKMIYEKSDEITYENGERVIMLLDEKEKKFTRNTLRLYEGLNLMKDSSEHGCSEASFHLYAFYSNWNLSSPLGKDEKAAWFYNRKHDEQQLTASSCRLWFLSRNEVPSLASFLPYSKEGVETVLRHRLNALRGDPESIFALSVCHQYGQGVRKDTDEALRLCKKSASLGYPLALLSMGNRYYDGTGVIKDEIEAYAYWNLAGVNLKEGGEYIAEMEKKLSESARLLSQKRARELQAEIEANKSKANHK
jgi:TPR repeat protein